MYLRRHADIRTALKPLTEAYARWHGILRGLAGEPGFDLSRKEAIESSHDLADQAKQLLDEQSEYFNWIQRKRRAGTGGAEVRIVEQ